MRDENMTRRSAVKLGGTALAAVGLGAVASARPSDMPDAPSKDYPDFRGKAVVFYTRDGQAAGHTLIDPTFVVRAGRLFLTGTIPSCGYWTDGLSSAVAWEAVDNYLVFDSVEAYYAAREKAEQSDAEAKAKTPAAANNASDSGPSS